MSQGTFTTRIEMAYRTPDEALRLNEDIIAMRLAVQLLVTVDRYNVNDDPDADVLWTCIHQIKMCKRYAENKMRREYLVPPPTKRMNGRRTRNV